MSSSSSLVSSSRRIGEEEEEEEEDNENPPPTCMLFRFQQLEEQSIATTTCTNTQLPGVPSIMDIIGCDITIDDIQSVKQELIKNEVDLKMNVNENQKLRLNESFNGWITPLIYFCWTGNLLIVKLLFLMGADCTELGGNNYWFPMLAAARYSHLDICKWLFEYGGDAKYQINKETRFGDTPLQQSYLAWYRGRDKEGKACRWLLLNGGGQHLSSKAIRELLMFTNNTNSNLLVLWMRECIQLHHTFILFLCGAATITMTTSSSSKFSDGDIRKYTRKRKIHPERSLQILDGQPGIMELIGEYVGLIQGKEFRMIEEFNELVIEYNNTEESSSERRWWW